MGAEWKCTPSQRLLARATPLESGCLLWTGFTNKDGYGCMGYRGRTSVLVHRVAYLEWVGPIADGMVVDHTCHTNDLGCPGGRACPHRPCIEPSHLELVTTLENTLRGRSFSVANAAKTECPQGHEYNDENTILYNGRRYCRPCTYRRTREYKAKKRAEVTPCP